MRTVPQSPANDNVRAHLVDAIAGEFEQRVRARVDGLPFSEFESVLLEAANEGVRRALEGRLQAIADNFGDLVEVAGRVYRRHQPGTVRYYSLCGPLHVKRFTYRLVEKRNGPTCVPTELAAGLVLGSTPALAFALTQAHAKAPIRSVEQDLRAAHRRPPSCSTMDRIVRALGGLVNDAVDTIEPELRKAERVPSNAVGINIGIDRTTIPMEEADEEPRAKSAFVVRYRMAYVGTVCITDAACNPLVTRRYAAPAHEDPERLITRMMRDVGHALEERPDLHIGIVQDNAPELWTRMRRAMNTNFPGRKWRETVDRYHLMARLAEVLEDLHPGERAANLRQRRISQWKALIEKSDDAVRRIVRSLARIGRARSLDWYIHVRRRTVYTAHHEHFEYASLKPLGLHSGSGVTEGACKSLIAMRAKRSGQRWRMPGISAVLAVRTLLESERLWPFWQIFEQRFHATCIDRRAA